jgi:hypothetical protein
MQTAELDLVKELRLRQWARANYVPRADRCETWHPVVMDEMHRRDEELAERTLPIPHSSRYVPLPPS